MFQQSTYMIPFSAFCTLQFLWFFVLAPLVCVGANLANKHAAPNIQTRPSNDPSRLIPSQPWYADALLTTATRGVPPLEQSAYHSFMLFRPGVEEHIFANSHFCCWCF
mmetsp:Transcript_33071/g.76207  ORF Transcript_33071/g.76207 Transcript_33071/m.76207 type:complete len:108 (+) Transcript_33071:402-725(+)